MNLNLSSRLLVFVYTHHPLAFQAIEKALASTNHEVRAYSESCFLFPKARSWMLIIDTHSVEEWPKIAGECWLGGGRCIVLVPNDLNRQEAEGRFIYLGIHGLVPMTKLEDELIDAVHSVSEGRLWISRETLDTCMKRINALDDSMRLRGFTLREEQIIPFLITGLSNKDIANTLRISHRTVKFHVSNILRKFNVESRKALAKSRLALGSLCILRAGS